MWPSGGVKIQSQSASWAIAVPTVRWFARWACLVKTRARTTSHLHTHKIHCLRNLRDQMITRVLESHTKLAIELCRHVLSTFAAPEGATLEAREL